MNALAQSVQVLTVIITTDKVYSSYIVVLETIQFLIYKSNSLVAEDLTTFPSDLVISVLVAPAELVKVHARSTLLPTARYTLASPKSRSVVQKFAIKCVSIHQILKLGQKFFVCQMFWDSNWYYNLWRVHVRAWTDGIVRDRVLMYWVI